MKRAIALLMFPVAFTGCIALQRRFAPDHVPTIWTNPRHQYTGFSVQPPTRLGWWVRISEQTHHKAVFRYERLRWPHTFFAGVQVVSSVHPEESVENFAERIFRERADSDRGELLERTYVRDAQWGPDCISYRILELDRHVPQWMGPPLQMLETGFACPHATIIDLFVVGYYSERAVKVDSDERLGADGREFLAGVVIESSPGVPAV